MEANVSPSGRRSGETLQDWIIAVIAGVAGVLLLAIVVLALCCFKRRKKARGGKNILTLTVLPVLKLPNIHPHLPFQYKVEEMIFIRVVTSLFLQK